jgi:hypothetical protein
MVRYVASGAIFVVAVIAGVLAWQYLQPRSVTPQQALAAPRFVEELAIQHVYDGGPAFAVGGGVAAFDCNGDGLPELYVAGGSGPAAMFHNDSAVGGALRFSRVSDVATDLVDVNGAYPIDIDGDGLTDLVVLRNGETVLLRGLGDCRFERANERWGFSIPRGQTEAFSATWEDPNALPTLAFGQYLQPNGLDCVEANFLVRPAADGTKYGEAAPLAPGYCPLSMLFSDWDRSGRRDLRITNDRQYYPPGQGQDQLWRIERGQQPRLFTDADGWVALQVWGMGIASYDVTGDGYPDVYLTSQGDNKLQTLAVGPQQPRYRDIALKRGVTSAQPFAGGDALPSTAWHPQFEDVNNDGFIDLFVSKGNVSAMAEYAQRDPSDLFLGQPDGTFAEAADSAGVLNFLRARGAALVDLNGDGLLDLVLVNYGGPVRMWRNTGPGGNWLDVRLSEDGANRDAIGASIEVKVGDTTLRRELTVGGGHSGGQLGYTHFGLGPSTATQVRVQWPDGDVGPWQQAPANQRMTLRR